LSLDEEKETLRREKERQALNQLEKARVSGTLGTVGKTSVLTCGHMLQRHERVPTGEHAVEFNERNCR
jgi:hypothetical protein